MCLSNRIMVNHSISLAGVGLILIFLITSIYLIHNVHLNLDETRNKLQKSEVNLELMTRQADSLLGYKTRLERALLTLKTEKTSAIETEHISKIELDELRVSYSKQIEILETELRLCQRAARTGREGTGKLSLSNLSGHLVPNISPSLLPSVLPYRRYPGADRIGDTIHEDQRHVNRVNFNKKSVIPEIQENHNNAKGNGVKDKTPVIVMSSLNVNSYQQPHQFPSSPPPQPILGDPNEDLAGNVLI